ncbi:MAG TPA: hypothetical protein VHQ66_09060 [Myxococcota bacterium]|nr:hypothetical protein [Myxococcota bacterium]
MRAVQLAAAAAAALLAAACAWLVPGAHGSEPGATGSAMAEIVAALRVALPLSLSASRFEDPANRRALDASLGALREGAQELESHGRSQDASFAYLSRSLARDAEDIKRRFDAGRLDESRFLLGALVEDCVGCHSRLPSAEDSGLGADLYRQVDTTALSPLERARLEVATRQFEAALERYEALLAAPDASPAELDVEGVIADYLTVAIRVKQDLPRARATLAKLAARRDVPSYLATLLRGWVAACESLAGSLDAADPLAEAVRVAERGAKLERFPRDRAAFVHELVASSLLLRHVAAHPDPSLENAQAYFLLGVAELSSGRSLWLSAAQDYLETAIRMAPGSDWAKRAYVVLEEETLADYSGSGGVHVPPDVRESLRELQREAVGGEGGAAPPSAEHADPGGDAADGDAPADPAAD